MNDVAVTRSGELMVAGVRADTEEGTTFVDGWFPSRHGAEFTVVDSGRLVIQDQDADDFVRSAQAAGLRVFVEKGL